MRATQLGVILGTAGYMAPEQAKGKPVDKRADIWAFGVVLYEMLTGESLFTGETVSDILAAVLTREPDLDRVPALLRKLLRSCLEKEPKKRLRDIADAWRLVEEPSAAPPASARVRHALLLSVLAAVSAIAAAGGWYIAWRAARPVPFPMMRFSADLGPDAVAGTLLSRPRASSTRITVAISPDGTRIVYPVRAADATLLATRLLDQSKATILSGTENATDPFFSPDGQWIGFFSDEKMKKVAVEGGAPLTLSNNPIVSANRGASWGEDGAIVATIDSRRLYRVPEAGGKPQMLALKTDPADPAAYRWPQILPGGEAVLFTAGMPGMFDEATIAVAFLKTGEVKNLVRGGFFGRYLPSGHLVYIHQGTLFGVRFNLERLEVRGQPVPIQPEVAANATTGGGELDFSVGPLGHGTLVYLSGRDVNSLRSTAWMDNAGKTTQLTTPAAAVFTPRLSPDGKLLALAMTGDIYTYDPQRSAMTRITFGGATNLFPVWTPDRRHIVYGPRSSGIWWTRADGSAQPERILEGDRPANPGSFSPDGRRLAYSQLTYTQPQIWILPLDTTDPDHPKPGKPELFPGSAAGNYEPAFSPDGKWLAFTATDSNTYQVYVRPYPATAGSGKWQISTCGWRIANQPQSGDFHPRLGDVKRTVKCV
jgi:serine/threonine-protein kinase